MVISHTVDGHRAPASPPDLGLVFLSTLQALSPDTCRLVSEAAARYAESKRGRVRFLSQRFLRVR